METSPAASPPHSDEKHSSPNHGARGMSSSSPVVSSKCRTNKPNADSFPLYGLSVMHHGTQLTFKNETPFDLPEKLKEICDYDQSLLDEYLAKQREVLSSASPRSSDTKPASPVVPSKATHQPAHNSSCLILNHSTRMTLMHLLHIYENDYLPSLEAFWEDYQHQHPGTPLNPGATSHSLHNAYSPYIIPGVLEFRSVFTWLIHKLQQISKLKHDVRVRMEHVVDMILEYGVKILQSRLARKSVNSNGKLSINVFSEDIDFDADERIKQLNVNDFLGHIGDEYRYSFSWFYQIMIAVTAAFSRSGGELSSISSKVSFAFYQPYYMVRPQLAAEELVRFFKRVTIDQGRALWNLQDDPFFRIFLYSALPHVDRSSVFTIPSFSYEQLMSEPIKDKYLKTLHQDKSPVEASQEDAILSDQDDTILVSGNSSNWIKNEQKLSKAEPDLGNDSTGDSPSESEYKSSLVEHETNDVHESPNSIDQEEIELVELQHVHKDSSKIQVSLNQKQDFPPLSQYGGISLEEFHYYRKQLHLPLQAFQREHIEVRLLYHGKNRHVKNFNFNRAKSDYPILSSLVSTFHRCTGNAKVIASAPHSASKSDLSQEEMFHGNIVVMLHGGGTVSMSTAAHESYMRELARETGLPIFMVEYTTAPDEQYPAQIEQCYHAYKWVVNNAERYLGVPLQKVFLTGDSAGGNFSASLIVRCIEDEFRVPDGALLTYPLTNFASFPSPARMLSLLDPLVNISFMKMCSHHYPHKEANLQRDPFLSPAFAPDEILKQFPPVIITVGALDPLYDDTLMLSERLTWLNGHKNVRLIVVDGLGHGYMNVIDFVGESAALVKNYAQWIHGMIEKMGSDSSSPSEGTLEGSQERPPSKGEVGTENV